MANANRRPLLLFASFAFLVQILNAGLVDQQVGRARTVHLQAVLVVPLDGAVDLLAVLQHQHHGGVGLHLFLVIEILGVGLLRRRQLLAAVHGALVAVVTLAAVAIPTVVAIVARMIIAVKGGTYKLATGKGFMVNDATQTG